MSRPALASIHLLRPRSAPRSTHLLTAICGPRLPMISRAFSQTRGPQIPHWIKRLPHRLSLQEHTNVFAGKSFRREDDCGTMRNVPTPRGKSTQPRSPRSRELVGHTPFMTQTHVLFFSADLHDSPFQVMFRRVPRMQKRTLYLWHLPIVLLLFTPIHNTIYTPILFRQFGGGANLKLCNPLGLSYLTNSGLFGERWVPLYHYTLIPPSHRFTSTGKPLNMGEHGLTHYGGPPPL